MEVDVVVDVGEVDVVVDEVVVEFDVVVLDTSEPVVVVVVAGVPELPPKIPPTDVEPLS